MKTLVIVESPGKVKKIREILGAGYSVVASVGHVRDLPPRDIGMSPPNFNLKYEPTTRGAKILANLRAEAKKAEMVLLATDPDREGEAIAWHLADALKPKKYKRITFSAITEAAIKEAIKNPRDIDMDLVYAQETRRALDRLVGWRVSPALSRVFNQTLSAGRAQTPAVRLIVDRERAIENFKVTEHFGVELGFIHNSLAWKAEWDTKDFLEAGEKYFLDEEVAAQVAKVSTVTVSEYTETKASRSPSAPFITSSLQQEAGKKLKFTPKKTMEVAQKLYEQGVITYHRTDAPNLDKSGALEIANYAKENGLKLAEKQRTWKSKEGAQEGHEAIRPTIVDNLNSGSTNDEQQLYQLIWQRAVASQLENAVFSVRTVVLTGTLEDGRNVSFIAKGRTLISAGWLEIYSDIDESEDQEVKNPVPFLEKNASLGVNEAKVLRKKTRPLPRYTQATLVAEMEKMGIGRPSTYAAIIENIISRSYVSEAAKQQLMPTDLGKSVRDSLVNKFQFAELDYTKELEEKLDHVSTGSMTFLTVISDAWQLLDKELPQLEEIEVPIDHPCPECKKALVRKKGRYGFFWSCTAWPECNLSLPDNNGVPGEPKVSKLTEYKCTSCEAELVRRKGVSKPKKKNEKGKEYDFYACSAFPKCKETYNTSSDGSPILTAKR